jgi:hypothetical protein
VDLVLPSLIHYQQLSLELARLNARLADFPAQIRIIDEEIELASSDLAAAEGAVSDSQKQRRDLEGDLQDLETQKSKYNQQLMQVKTNDAYKAMQHEIAGVDRKIGDVEEKILLLLEEADVTERRVKEERISLEGRRKEAEKRKAAIGDDRAKVEQEAARVSTELKTAREGLSAEALNLFERIAGSRNGIALARALDERCQECKVRLRPQAYQLIKKGDNLIQCDSCQRILYYVESPTADTPAQG